MTGLLKLCLSACQKTSTSWQYQNYVFVVQCSKHCLLLQGSEAVDLPVLV